MRRAPGGFAVPGVTYLIGRTKLGYGFALVWQSTKQAGSQVLTWPIVEQILDEAEKAGAVRPVVSVRRGRVDALAAMT